MPKLSRDARDERRQHILRAAAACFARDGFHRTTIADVCAEAEVSTGAVYTYFPNKEAIVRALLQGAQAERQAALEAATRDGVPRPEVLLEWARALFEPEGRHRARVDVNLWAEALRDRRIGKLAEGAVGGAREAIGATVARALAAAGPAGQGVQADAVSAVLVAIFLGLEIEVALGLPLRAADVLTVLAGLFAPYLGPAAAPAAAPRTTTPGRTRRRPR
jgi:AcrR family transcriptional regulator